MNTSVGYINHSCSEHKCNCYEIIFYRKGAGRFCFSENNIPVSSGKFIIVPPNTLHFSEYTEEAETFFIHGDFNHIFSLSSPMVVMDNAEKNGEFLMKMIFDNRFSNPEYLLSLSDALAHFLLQNIQTEKNINIVLQDILTKISHNFYDSNLNIDDIFKKSGYAKDYIRAQFKILTGKTPVELLTEMRINHARYLIDIYKDSLPLAEIAEKCGYLDYVYFSRRFKDITGLSPKNYINININKKP